jgi:hypothetical protein
MVLLKPKNKRMDYRLVGVNLPPRIHSFLSLWCAAKGMKKAEKFKELIVAFMDEQRLHENDDDLIRLVVHRAQTEWKFMLHKRPQYKFETFKIELEQELLDKGILPEYVTEIIQQLNAWKETQN